MHDLSLADWLTCIDVNLTGAFLCLKHQVWAMLDRGGGSILVVGSTTFVKGYPHASEYAASKAGLLGLIRCSAYEYAPANIRITGSCLVCRHADDVRRDRQRARSWRHGDRTADDETIRVARAAALPRTLADLVRQFAASIRPASGRRRSLQRPDGRERDRRTDHSMR